MRGVRRSVVRAEAWPWDDGVILVLACGHRVMESLGSNDGTAECLACLCEAHWEKERHKRKNGNGK